MELNEREPLLPHTLEDQYKIVKVVRGHPLLCSDVLRGSLSAISVILLPRFREDVSLLDAYRSAASTSNYYAAYSGAMPIVVIIIIIIRGNLNNFVMHLPLQGKKKKQTETTREQKTGGRKNGWKKITLVFKRKRQRWRRWSWRIPLRTSRRCGSRTCIQTLSRW